MRTAHFKVYFVFPVFVLRLSCLVPLLVQQQMGCWGKERERKLHAESTPSSCQTEAKKVTWCNMM